MGRSDRRVMYLSVFVYVIVIAGSKSMSYCYPEKHSPLFIFGDSLFDSGNNNYIKTTNDLLSNYQPYGHTFFNFPTGRFSDGRLIPDFLAEYAELPLLPPYLFPGIYKEFFVYGINFASAGSGALLETRQGTVINLKTQARYFTEVRKEVRKKVGDAKAKALISRAVFLFSVGGNDYATPFLLANSSTTSVLLPYPPQQFVDVVIGNITSVIQKIYDEGGRKLGFANLGPLNCFPALRRKGSSIGRCEKEGASALATLHNKAFLKSLENLQKKLEGLTYSIFDFNTALIELMKNPSKHDMGEGFKEGNVACCGGGPYRGDYSCGGKRGISEYEKCGNASEYVFFDSIHPTQSAAQHFANLMWSANTTIVQPYNLKQLFQFRI